jgi:hypothetical protein
VRGRSLLAFGVNLDQRRVDVQHDLGGCRSSSPRRGSGPRSRCPQTVEHAGVDLVERSPDRRSRGDLTEHVGLITQRRHVRHTPATSGEHQRHLNEQPTAVVTEGALPVPRDSGIGRCQTELIGEFPQQMGASVGDRLTVTASHPQPFHRACTVHLASALPVRVLDASQHQESLTARALPRIRDPQPTQTHERSGLGMARPAAADRGQRPAETRVGMHGRSARESTAPAAIR